jgi:hypothetical protein
LLRTGIKRKLAISGFADGVLCRRVERLRNGHLPYFFAKERFVDAPPKWFHDPISGVNWRSIGHWTETRDFGETGCDIKSIWELSRFYWMLDFARAYQSDGNEQYLSDIEEWVQDWLINNPVNQGPNWACGQEVSVRLIHFLTTLKHCSRIYRTMHYAKAQDNNHGTSEAAALFAGALWLLQTGDNEAPRKRERQWLRQGRKSLEERIRRLVLKDGSFSQNSTNYHRLLIDTLSFVEIWRRTFKERPFSDLYYERVRLALDWLVEVTDPKTGESPNIGGNDGALLIPLNGCDYRDFRPSIQLASCVFRSERVYEPGPWDEPVARFQLKPSGRAKRSWQSSIFPCGGYIVLKCRQSESWGVLRLPVYRFRPAHADALHLDLWDGQGRNIVRDGGSYSYAAAADTYNYFNGTRSHSTCEFDGRNQMPRHSRFLFDEWLKPVGSIDFSPVDQDTTAAAGYTDWRGATHCRSVKVEKGIWTVRDELDGYIKFATIRWRLCPGQWQSSGRHLVGNGVRIQFEIANGELISTEIVNEFESRYYLQQSTIPVWTIKLAAPNAVVVTQIAVTD